MSGEDPRVETAATVLPTRERQRRATQNLILEIALEEIRTLGLDGARIEHIARKAGVTRPTIYAHFPSKQDFLRELQRRSERATRSELQRRLGGASDGADLARRLLDALFDLLESSDPVLRREVFALLVREPAQADWMGNPLFGFLTARFAEAQQRHELPDGLPASEFTRILMTALFGFLVIESEPLAARRRAAHRMLELLIGAPKARKT